MFREITLFDGGINNLISPHFIGDNQSPYVLNADIRHGILVSQKEKKEQSSVLTGKYGYYYKAKKEVIRSDEDRFYVEWGGFLYWSNSIGTLKRYDGTTISDIGSHSPPVNAPTAAVGTTGLLNGDYWYTYTYVHDNVFESPPSPFTNITIANNQANISFSGTVPATATHRRIYRAGGLNPTFNLLVEIPIATASYTDNISDFSISRTELTTYNNSNPPVNLDMIVETGGVIFGAVGDKVYFSQQGQPEYWSEYNYIQVSQDITGLGVIGNSVVAFTIDSMHIITGQNMSNIQISKLPFSYGCKNKRTVQSVEGSLVWVAEMDSNDVICIFNGNSVTTANRYATSFNSSTIESLSYDDFGIEAYDTFNFDILSSMAGFNKYYLFMNGRTAVVDFLNNAKVYYLKDSCTSGYIIKNDMYVIENNKEYIYTPSFSAYRPITYKTKTLIDGYITQKKSYRYIKINASGNYRVDILVDEIKVADTTTDKVFIPSGITGNSISFVITTTGYVEVKAISYEYDLLKE